MRILLVFAVAAGMAFPQTSVKVEEIKPDCTIYFTLSVASPASVTYDNRQTSCVVWTMSYQNTGFAALTLTVQAAPDVAGAPGVWAAFPGIVWGVNPNVALTNEAAMFIGYDPWMRVLATGIAGAANRITGRLYGYRRSPYLSLSIGGGPGGSTLTYLGCTGSAAFNTAAAGNTRIVPEVVGPPAQVIRICHISLSTFPAEDVYFTWGTGATCAGGGGPVAMTGTYRSVLGMALDLAGTLTVPAGNALCINQAGAQNVGGVVTFSQYVP